MDALVAGESTGVPLLSAGASTSSIPSVDVPRLRWKSASDAAARVQTVAILKGFRTADWQSVQAIVEIECDKIVGLVWAPYMGIRCLDPHHVAAICTRY